MSYSSIILYAEDDIDDFQILSEAIKNMAANIGLVHAKNGSEVIQYLESALKDGGLLPQLVILDYNMPVMDGGQTLLKIKDTEGISHIKTIIFTTNPNKFLIDTLEELETTVIAKPTNTHDLREIAGYFISLV